MPVYYRAGGAGSKKEVQYLKNQNVKKRVGHTRGSDTRVFRETETVVSLCHFNSFCVGLGGARILILSLENEADDCAQGFAQFRVLLGF